MVDRTVMQSGRYKAYPEYKGSGVKWIDDIPNGWSIERIKRMLALKRNLVGAASSEYQLLSLTLKGVIPRDISSGEGKIPASFDTYQEVDRNDLVFCLFDIDETPRTIGLSSSKGMITGAYNVYQTTSKCLPSYAYYYFLYIDLRKGLRPFYTGLRKVVRSETFSNIEMPCPSYEEQKQIASFLDYETAKIDTLIEKQQRLIELLTEKRQAVISHAVTKGLNPDVPMKDSGVKWLGEVPEHWELPKLIQQTSRIGDGLHSTPKYQDNTGYYFVNGNNLVNGQIVIGVSAKEVPEDEYIKHFIPLDETSVLLSINGTIGNVARYKGEKVILGKSASYMNCSNQLTPEYLILYLQSSQVRHYFDLEVTGTTIYNLSLNSLRQMKVCIPPKSEQLDIDGYCNAQKDKYDFLIEKANLQIQLMQERRTALISAAVTGKIDVRNWVKPE